jgi:tetratricopeptide (TPR) repeat protein
MSQGNNLSSSPSPVDATLPSSPAVAEGIVAALQSLPPPDSGEETARQQIAALDREAKALGNEPTAALLFHEMGVLWEEVLKNPRNAAVAYQNAYRLAPGFLANIRAARRLFSEVGNWAMVIQLLDAELAATEDAAQKAALWFEKGTVLEDHLSREQEAASAFAQCLELRPNDISLLVQLEGVYAAKKQYASLSHLYRLLAAAVTDDAVRTFYWVAAASLLEDRLKLPEEAAEALQQAFKVSPKDPLVLASMVRLAEQLGRDEELLAALSAQAELGGPRGASHYSRISKVLTKMGREEDALAALLAARKISPGDPLILSELATIYQARGAHDALANVLSSWADQISDEKEIAAINLRLAALFEEVLRRDEDAVARYRAILTRMPGNAAALAGLGKLYHRTQNWEGLISVFDLEVAGTEDPKQKAAHLYKGAEILERHLKREEEALARYNQCLQLEPRYLPAQQALIRLYERQGRHRELVAIYEQEILQAVDGEQVIAMLNKMAMLYEERLSDLDQAIDCMKRTLELAPDHLPTLRNLARLYENSGRWRELIQIHETQASIVGDTKQVLSLHHRNAEILEEQLDDRPGAIAAYQRLLSLSPAYLPALTALGRLYSQQERWAELIGMYRAEAEIAAPGEQTAALVYRIGELYEQKLKQENEAIAAYQEVLAIAPKYYPALRALEQIFRARGDWERLIEILRAQADQRTSPLERAHTLYQAAVIWEVQLKQRDRAIAGYHEVLRLAPAHVPAAQAMERLYAAPEDIRELIDLLEREAQTAEAPDLRSVAQLKLAQLFLERLDDAPRAAQACEAVLAIDPTNLSALKMLERLRASDPVRLSELRLQLAGRVSDARLSTALKLLAVADGGALDEATRMELETAFARNPADARLAFQLEQALQNIGDQAALVRFHEKVLETLSNPIEKLGLILRIADLAERKLQDWEKALAFYRRAVELNPQLALALEGVKRASLQLGDYASARGALEALGSAARDARGALDAFVAAGRIAMEKLNDRDSASANFRRALERDPLHPAAAAGLQEILAQGSPEELAAFQERLGEAKLAQKELPSASAQFLLAARTWLQTANDRAKALKAVQRALAAQPTNAEALELNGDLALEANEFAEAAAAFAARIRQGGEASALVPIHLKLAGLYLDQLSDSTRGAAHLQTVLSTDPRNVEALERMAALYLAGKNWNGAADCLKFLLETDSQPVALARHSLSLARVYEEGFGNPALASSLYRRALDLAPGDLSIVERLVELYERLGNTPELLQMLEQQAERSADGKHSAALRVKIGDLYAKSVNDSQKALANYRQAIDRDPACMPARVALADLYMRDAASAPNAIDAHRQLWRLDPTRIESIQALFRLWHGLRQLDKAFCAAGLLQFFRAAGEPATAFYAEARNRLPQQLPGHLAPEEVRLLVHARARNPLLDVLLAIGDQLSKLYPPDLQALGADRRASRLKGDHPLVSFARATADALGVEELEIYQSGRGTLTLETSDPLCLCVSAEVLQMSPREQRFVIGRGLMGLLNKSAIAHKLSAAELADLLAAAIRLYQPAFDRIGHPSAELSRQLGKVCSRKSRKALEETARGLGEQTLDVEATLRGLAHSADRAGMLVCGEVPVALGVALREDRSLDTAGIEKATTEQIIAAVRRRPELEELVGFALSDEHFSLREKSGMRI